MSTVSKSLQLIIVVHRCQTVVDTRLVQSVGVGRSIYKVSHSWIERELMVVRYGNLTSFHTTLGLHQESTVHALIAQKSHSSGILQYRNRFYLVNGQIFDRTLDAVYQHQYAILGRSLLTTNVEYCSGTIVTDRSARTQHRKSQQFSIKSLFQRDGGRFLQLIATNHLHGSGSQHLALLNTHS